MTTIGLICSILAIVISVGNMIFWIVKLKRAEREFKEEHGISFNEWERGHLPVTFSRHQKMMDDIQSGEKRQ